MFERARKEGTVFPSAVSGLPRVCLLFCVGGSQDNPAKPIDVSRDLGFMLYDLDFTSDPKDPIPQFFRAYLDKGTINTDRREVEVRG